ncbi:MAG: hypothetical protein JWO25_3231 [Alphaproteobacteria bacterium]|nr:hypothetical protein [Alphaproteobacteria bacterium]
MDFNHLIAPIGADLFMSEYYGRRPLHIPAPPDSPRLALMSWDRLNALLGLWSHWSEANLKLIRANRPIAPDLYMEEISQQDGALRRASLAKVETFLAMGASLVANYVQSIAPEVRQVTDMLAERFAGVGNANLYCSFEGVQAFNTHYDMHEVFAVHSEGEKVWRIYANRSAEPVENDATAEALQRRALAERGELLLEVTMRPGDLLYIPRGFYHDALASSRESLHLTLSVMPASGRFFLKTLKRAAMREALLRAYLPDARIDGGAPLREHLDALAGRLAEIVRSPAFFESVAVMQRSLARPAHGLSLPSRPALESFARTGVAARVERPDGGALLVRETGEPVSVGGMADEVEWLLARPLVSLQELFARFPHQGIRALRELVEKLVEVGILKPALIRG